MKYKITNIVAEWVAYTYEVEAEDEDAALLAIGDGSANPVDGPNPVKSIDEFEDEMTIEEQS